jgi:hypothetical protein
MKTNDLSYRMEPLSKTGFFYLVESDFILWDLIFYYKVVDRPL